MDEPDHSATVLPFRRPRRRNPFLPVSAGELGVRAYLNPAPGEPRPYCAVLELSGQRIGVLGTFTDDEEGHAAAEAVARVAMLTIDILANTAPTGDRIA